MSDELFGELMQSLDQALQYSRGEQISARTTVLPAPPKPMSRQEIIKLRERFNCSQAVFARLLNVSVKTLQAWEQGGARAERRRVEIADHRQESP